MNNWTITQATDWPMFVFMLGLLGAMFLFLWAIVVILIRSYHKEVMDRIASQRKEDSKHCGSCQVETGKKIQRIWRKIGTMSGEDPNKVEVIP